MHAQDQPARHEQFPLPHPDDIAARKALAARPPVPLERVLAQAEASRQFIAEWRANGRPDCPTSLNPNLAPPQK